ncbi:MAG: endonuclease/exonuclease/phosphatase family metal-dependent hydrolase [Planctomycetota bacterium]|jgi:endonuclease/exonuclease/phosphatase family metal-dependent hydrolase
MNTESQSQSAPTDSPRTKVLRRLRKFGIGVAAFGVLLFMLFLVNANSESWKEPRVGSSSLPLSRDAQNEVKIVAYNIAKCFAYTGATRFATTEEVKGRLDRIALLLNEEKPDLVFLSEVVNECGPRPFDQVEYLANKCGFASWATGDNYSWGLPFFRIRSGNAVLSRFPLSNFKTMGLVSESSIWNPTNNRRVLWCDVEINGQTYLAGSLRNDSFNLKNNSRQVDEILEFIGQRPTILAGDFNAEPQDEPMKKFKESKRFSGAFRGVATYPTRKPWRRIDYVLAPNTWTLKSDLVINTDISDHIPVVAVFSVPR